MRWMMMLFFLWMAAKPVQAQKIETTVSGMIKDKADRAGMPYVNVQLKKLPDSQFVSGTISDDKGRFTITGIKEGDYVLECSFTGYSTKTVHVFVGKLTPNIEVPLIEMSREQKVMDAVVVTAKQETVSSKMDKKTFSLANNISQSGGSVLEAMKNLPGVTVGQDGKVQLRGSDKITVLIDGKQTALTGFGTQTGLDNIPASAIDRIEVINNPSARYDANGNAGIINIIYKKEKKEGFNGKVGLTGGLGALWIKRGNYPGIRPQYQATPKINPSVALNYRKGKINVFFQGDDLYTKTLNKNEFADRYYDNGDTVRQQTKRNRTTNVLTLKSGIDAYVNNRNTLTLSGLFSSEKILDRGDEPFYNGDLTKRNRLWQFLEDELKTTVTVSGSWVHRFPQPGRSLSLGANYTFHREDEKYFFTNIMPSYTGLDSFKLLSDEHVADINLDYVQPLRYGRIEGGLKFRRRYIPTNMQFKPGLNSPLDTTAGGWANYGETIPAAYGNYVFENKHIEAELGLRVEYVHLNYEVNPGHNTYKSDGYHYTQPFPNLRLAWKINDRSKLSFFYNRRVDRPNEVDIRIFPKYDDAEIIKVGNPALRPQFTNSFELGYKRNWGKPSLYASVYHKRMEATITRIASTAPGSNLIYNVFQNAGRSYNTGAELLFDWPAAKWINLNLNLNGYQNTVEGFTVINKYPVTDTISTAREQIVSGNIKLNAMLHLPKKWEGQLSMVYLAPDLVPQGKTFSRFYIDMGVKKTVQKGKGELFINVSDIANTSRLRKEIQGKGFRYLSTDYYETQVFRIGYMYKF